MITFLLLRDSRLFVFPRKLSNHGMFLQVTPLDNEAVTVCPLEVVKAVAMVVAEAGFGQFAVDEDM